MAFGDSIFGTMGHLSWWQECWRAAFVFAYGLVLVRLAGRRVFGKWAALDIIVSIIVGSNLSRAITGGAPLVGTLAATALLMGLHWILAQGTARFRPISRLLEGGPIALAERGSLDPAKLSRDAISAADLDEALRVSGVERVSETRLIMLEPSGKITVLKAG
jgi:uncharacterized membrane protein YcaP (DUF421 family)